MALVEEKIQAVDESPEQILGALVAVFLDHINTLRRFGFGRETGERGEIRFFDHLLVRERRIGARVYSSRLSF